MSAPVRHFDADTLDDQAEALAALLAAVFSHYLEPQETETEDGDYAIVPRIRDALAGKGPMPLRLWMHYAAQAMAGPTVGPMESTIAATAAMDPSSRLTALAGALADHAKFAMEAEIRAQVARHIIEQYGSELIVELLNRAGES